MIASGATCHVEGGGWRLRHGQDQDVRAGDTVRKERSGETEAMHLPGGAGWRGSLLKDRLRNIGRQRAEQCLHHVRREIAFDHGCGYLRILAVCLHAIDGGFRKRIEQALKIKYQTLIGSQLQAFFVRQVSKYARNGDVP